MQYRSTLVADTSAGRRGTATGSRKLHLGHALAPVKAGPELHVKTALLPARWLGPNGLVGATTRRATGRLLNACPPGRVQKVETLHTPPIPLRGSAIKS
eukprot:1272007-Alexandrium_andersonii.AAC.1